MKVLQTLPELNAGGVERGVLEIGRYLAARGHASLVVSNGGVLVPALTGGGSRHFTLPVHRKHPVSLFQAVAFRRLLRRERPDILHLRSRVPGWIAWLAWRSLPRASRPRLVSTVHGFYSVNAYSAIMTRGERVIAVSDSTYNYILRNYPRVDPARVRRVPRGLDPAAYPRGFTPAATWLEAWRAEHPGLEGRRVLTLPGRVTRLKGHEDFLRLLAALRAEGSPVHGLIVGGAHERKAAYLGEIKELTARLGLARAVTFTGHRTDLREIFAVSDLVFGLSTQPESFGRTTLEALALGRPVIGYDHGGVGEQLASMFPAGRVPLRDAGCLLQTTRALLVQPPVPGPVPPAYTLEHMCAATLAVYRELIPNDRAGE